jgi:hypothetical protein
LDPEALKVNGWSAVTLDQLDDSYYVACLRLINWLQDLSAAADRRLILHGWCVDIDRRFLEAMYADAEKAGTSVQRGFPWQHRTDDLHSHALSYLRRVRCEDASGLPSALYSATAAELLGVSPEPTPHRAWRGVLMELQMYTAIFKTHKNWSMSRPKLES